MREDLVPSGLCAMRLCGSSRADYYCKPTYQQRQSASLVQIAVKGLMRQPYLWTALRASGTGATGCAVWGCGSRANDVSLTTAEPRPELVACIPLLLFTCNWFFTIKRCQR